VSTEADHLLRLVIERVAHTWREVQREASGRFGPGPTALILYQCDAADWEKVRCSESIVRTWVHDERGTPERDPTPSELAGVTEKMGMCFVTGRVWFCLDGAMKRVVYTFMVGPRFGRGMVLRVEAGSLLPEPVPMWVS
jgi:hypothetical protein